VTIARINPGDLPRPSGFSHAVSAASAATVYLAGQTGTTPDGALVPGGIVPQFEQALANLLTALAAAGGRPQDLASLTVYLTDIEDYQAHSKEIGAVWRRLAGPRYPAMAAVGVTRLWDPRALVELQGIAALPALSPPDGPPAEPPVPLTASPVSPCRHLPARYDVPPRRFCRAGIINRSPPGRDRGNWSCPRIVVGPGRMPHRPRKPHQQQIPCKQSIPPAVIAEHPALTEKKDPYQVPDVPQRP
jgi:enamine deaminase RidA (YjgF/YER057c/UK114 family)